MISIIAIVSHYPELIKLQLEHKSLYQLLRMLLLAFISLDNTHMSDQV